MRRTTARKLSLLALGLAAVFVVVSLPSWGQEAFEPSGEIASADCYGHHKQEGFRSMDLFPKTIQQAPSGKEFPFQLTIKNPWLHDLQNVQAYVNISGAPGLEFPGAKPPTNVTKDITIAAAPTAPSGPPTGVPLASGASTTDLPVEANATDMIVSLVASPGTAAAVDQRSDFELSVVSPDKQVTIKDATQPAPATPGVSQGRHSQTVDVDQENLTRVGAGTWKANVKYTGLQTSATAKLSAVVYYNLSQSRELVVNGPALLKPGEQYTFTFTVVAKSSDALQNMRYGGRATAYHQHTDKSIGDTGTYDKWNTLPAFKLGSAFVEGGQDVSAQGATVSLLEPVLRRWGQVLGFAGSFLVIPSLVFGGTFGRKTVDWTNGWFGSARRRVLFHNSLSFWLLGIATLHMFVFFYEAFWPWSHGLVWGGLALASMIGLGVTGATQRQFVARWGFTRWRFVHFAMGVLVVVFVLIHMTVDGSHFAPIREFLFGRDPSRIGM